MPEVATVKMPTTKTKYSDAFGKDDNASLSAFLRKLKKFEDVFCAYMFSGEDFTLRLEVRGNKHVLLHARLHADEIDRPDGAESRLDKIKKSAD